MGQAGNMTALKIPHCNISADQQNAGKITSKILAIRASIARSIELSVLKEFINPMTQKW